MSQLDLFEGVVLSEKQQELLTEFQTNNTRKTKIAHERNINMVNALIEGGFVKDVDFENTFETKVVTNDVQLGYSFKGNQFEAKDVTYNTNKGGVCFLSKRYNKVEDKVVDTKINYYSFDGNKNKIECESVVGSYRAVKLTTLLTKLQEHRERAESAFKQEKEQKIAFAKVIAKLQAKCPAADVLSITEGVKYGTRYFEVRKVKAQFENGSYVMFNVRVSDSTYSVDRKYDAELLAMSTDEVLANFTNQNK